MPPDNNNNIVQRALLGLAAGGIGSVFMLCVMSLVIFGPKPYPVLRPELRTPPHPSDGIMETTYFLVGLLKEEIPVVDGKPNGTAFQYYPNGSLLREIPYADGRIDGTVKEYYEKRVNVQSVSRRFVTQAQHLRVARGSLKSTREYNQGKPHGAHRFYLPNGEMREEKVYQFGRLISRRRY